MTQTLYFLSLIERALHTSHPRQALAAAFAQIQEHGRRTENAEGYSQFCLFLNAAMQHGVPDQSELDNQIADGMHLMVLDLAHGTLDVSPDERQAALEMIQAVPALRAQYDVMMAEATQEQRFFFVLERSGSTVLSPPRWDGRVLSGIAPGHYVLKLDTGRVLWHGELSKQHLLWRNAYPAAPLRVAASTQAADQPPTLRLLLLEGRAALLAFAGVEIGSVRVEVLETDPHGH
jgi:hypothetical protein